MVATRSRPATDREFPRSLFLHSETYPTLALPVLVLGRRRRVADRRSCPLAVGGDLGQTPVELVAKFVGVVVVLGPALAGHDHAGGGHAREAGDSDELPGHPHGP
jgi:hypothetical protein